MRVRDLGTLAVAVDADERIVTGTRGAAMLALLTINVNRRVSQDALIDAAWGDHPTSGASSTLESHIWRLRQLLEPGRGRRQSPTVLISDVGGFRLMASSASLDSLFLEECGAATSDLLAAGHPEAALRRADQALALWRGEPYGVFAQNSWATAAVTRLRELRGRVQEHRIQALLTAGGVEAAITDLPPLIAESPFRESLRGLLMQALYLDGRTEAALGVYQQARRTLSEEIGIEPGPTLQQLHHKILNNDPSLAPSRSAVELRGRPGEGSGARPGLHAEQPLDRGDVHLPGFLAELVGREETVSGLAALVAAGGLVTVTGAAGCGKTRVAVEAARAAADHYPDGVWFIDFSVVADPDLVGDVIASTVGFAALAGATPLEALRSYLQTRRILLVLDNCEHLLSAIADVVRVAFSDAAASDCCFLATSREPINLDNETVWTLSPLDVPHIDDGAAAAEAPAAQLFLRRLRAVAPTLRIDTQVLARIVDICRAVDGLPLALELAATRVRSYTLHDIAAQVSADPSRLSRIGGPKDHRGTLRSAIEWSHRLLEPDQQVLHRRLSVLPGEFTAELAAAVGWEFSLADVEDLLAQLVHRSMLTSDAASRPDQPTTFRQLATVRAHAEHLLVDAAETAQCLERRDAWTARLLASRPPLGSAAEIGWYRTLDDTYSSIRATLNRQLVDRRNLIGAGLPARLGYYWYYRQRLVEGSRWLQLSYEVLRETDHADPVDLQLARIALAAGLAVQGRLDLARPHILDLLEAPESIPPERLVEVGEAMVGLVTAAWVPDAHDLVVDLHRRLIDISNRAADPTLTLLADAAGCTALFAAGRIDDAVAQAQEVDRRAADRDNLMAAWVAAGSPTIAALLTANPAQGIPWVNRLMQTHLRLGTGADGSFIETRANFAAQAGEHTEAVQLYAAAYTETRRAGMVWPRRPLTEQLIALTRQQLSTSEYERHWQQGEQLKPAELVDPVR